MLRIVLVCILALLNTYVKGQSGKTDRLVPENNSIIPYRLSPKEWRQVQKVWNIESRPVVLTLKNNNSFRGQILLLDSTSITLWNDEYSFININRFQEDLIWFSLDSILSISKIPTIPYLRRGILWSTINLGISSALFFYTWASIPSLISFALSIPAGNLIGAAVDKSIKKQSPLGQVINLDSYSQQKKYVFYPDKTPDFIQKYSPSAYRVEDSNQVITFENLLSEASRAKQVFNESKFDLSLAAGFSYINNEKDLANGFSGDYNKRFWVYGISAGYKLSSRFKASYELLTNQSLRSFEKHTSTNPSDNYNHHEMIEKKSQSLYLNFGSFPVNRFTDTKLEASAGMGISINGINYTQTRTYFYSQTDFTERFKYTQNTKKIKIGFALAASAGFYLSNKTSVFLGVEKNILSPLSYEGETIPYPESGDIMTFEAKKYPLASFNILAGLRQHF